MNKDLKTLCFDLDDTLCRPNHGETCSELKYLRAEPIVEMIEYARNQYNLGHRIIIYTARRMLTHKGDIEKIRADVEGLTIMWLHDHCVPYHELVFGKPYADVYIDDKALNTKDILL